MLTKAENTVERILAAARAQFILRNFADVTMDDIARASGATKGALYHHFRSKDELYLEMMRRDLADKAELFRAAAEAKGSARERLRRLTANFFELPGDHQALSRLVRRDINIFKGEAREQLIAAYQKSLPDHVQRIIEEGIAAGELHAADARLAAWSYVALVEVATSDRAGVVLASTDAKLDFIEDLFFKGCATKRGEIEHEHTGI